MERLKVLLIDRKERVYTKSITNFNIINALKKKVNVNDLWILVESGRKLDYKNQPLSFNYKFYEDYKTDDLRKILRIEKPNIILISNDYDYFIRSFVPVAKSMGIPIVLLLQMPFFDYYFDKIDRSHIRGQFSILLDRGGYVFRKFLFMLKTYKMLGYSFPYIIKIAAKEIIRAFRFYFVGVGQAGCDLILVSGESWQDNLRKKNVKSKIIVTGHAQMDYIYHKISRLEEQSDKKRTKLVLLTTGMVEHGFWTKKEWEKTILSILGQYQKELSNEMDIVIKIHPATERKSVYVKLLKENGYDNIPIYQTEDLLTVLNDSDVVITYGYSGGAFEAIFLRKPIIVVNLFDYPINKMPFVKEGLAMEVKDINELKSQIHYAVNQGIDEDKLSKFISKYIFKFDGKSSERIADAILDLATKTKKRNSS